MDIRVTIFQSRGTGIWLWQFLGDFECNLWVILNHTDNDFEWRRTTSVMMYNDSPQFYDVDFADLSQFSWFEISEAVGSDLQLWQFGWYPKTEGSDVQFRNLVDNFLVQWLALWIQLADVEQFWDNFGWCQGSTDDDILYSRAEWLDFWDNFQ